MHELFRLMASYNTWMNEKLYRAAGALSDEELRAHRGAFFGSVLGTLNHIVVADCIWLQRFSEHASHPHVLAQVRELPKPASLDQIVFADFSALAEHRKMLDRVVEQWVETLTNSELEQALCFTTLKGARVCKRLSNVLLHFFNHQTHHRGQITTLLSQAGIDVGVTDLMAMLPNDVAA